MSPINNSAAVMSHVKTYSVLGNSSDRNTAFRVLEGVARSHGLMVVGGSVASPSPSQIQVINKALTTYRLKALQVPLPDFHQFVHSKMSLGECSTCITLNFDGLETRDRPELKPRTVMLHGDNNVLACSAPRCKTIEGEQVRSFDTRLLEGETVLCPSCTNDADENPRARIRPKPLRARVLLDGSIDPNIQWDRILAEAEGADTLLIAGTSLPSSDVYGMVDEIAQRIRRDGGAVVLIDTGDLTPRLAHLLDFHLKLDIQQCACAMLNILQRVSSDRSAESAGDIWEE
ncbi:hypothetical protein FRC10_008417, partial [Ceratobasidium sp. 414]